MIAYFLLEMPKNCAECPLNVIDDGCEENICPLIGHWKYPDFNDKQGRYWYCPLKPFPSTMDFEITDAQTKAVGKIDNSFRLGWNTCLGFIAKGE